MSDIRRIDTQGLESGTLTFWKSGLITVDDFHTDTDIDAQEYRAFWKECRGGEVDVWEIERNDARPGKPAYWVDDNLSFYEKRQLEKLIAAQLKSEHGREPEVMSMRDQVGPTEFWGVKA